MCRADRRLPVVPPRSRLEIEVEAKRVIDAAYPDLLTEPAHFPMVEFVEFRMYELYGYRFGVSSDLGTLEAVAYPAEKLIMIREDIYLNLEEDAPARFTLAHEIGHLALHKDFVVDAEASGHHIRLSRKFDIRAFEDPEWQANAFAAALLIPAPAASILAHNGSLDEETLIATFRVSAKCARKRVRELETLGWLEK